MKKLTAILLVLCLGMVPTTSFAASKKLVVGSKQFTEQIILGKIMIAMLDHNGFKTVDQTGLGGTMVARQALKSGQIDIYMEYTGTALINFLKHKTPITNPEKCYEVVKKEDLRKNGMVWLPMVHFNDTYCLMMRRADAEKKGIKTISDLSEYVKAHPQAIAFGLNAEFYARPDGYRGLQKKYDFRFPQDKLKKMDSGLVYKALKDGDVEVAMGFATDGRIKGFNFVVLKDNLQYFPVYNPAPVVRKATAEKYPQLKSIFKKLGAKLDTATMTRLNYEVDIEHKDAMNVAKDWLKSKGLI